MVVQKAVKSYPLVKWALVVSAVLAALGLWQSGVLGNGTSNVMLLVWYLLAAVVLPFLALLVPRRQVLTMELPSDHLAGMTKAELEGLLSQLDAAKAKGEMDDARYGRARGRVLEAIKAKGKAKA